jgi:nucleoside-diphosphate-sugar epimerase
MATALVFAGTSFVGGPLCAALRRQGARVVATARGTPPDGAVSCDLTRPDQVEAVVARERPDWVVQCAGATRTGDPGELYCLHVGGTLAVLGAVARHAPGAVVALLGSAAEYGPLPPEDFPITEDAPCRPATFFAASKLAQTGLARCAAREWSLRVLTVRPFNVVGPGLPEHYFAAALARRLLRLRAEGGPAEFPVANLDATRDFVDVRDVADALVALLTVAPPGPGEMAVYNVASGVEVPLREVAGRLGRLAGDFRPVDGGGGGSRGGVSRSRGDPTRLRRATGWVPRQTWQQSVDDLWRSLTGRECGDRCGRTAGRAEGVPR